MARTKACPRCWYGKMKRYQQDGLSGWDCWLCSLFIADDGHMFDSEGRINEYDTYSWPLKDEYEPIYREIVDNEPEL